MAGLFDLLMGGAQMQGDATSPWASMGGSLGTGFSNADREFVLDQVPNLSNTPQGNAALIDVQRKLNQRKQQIAQLARDYDRARLRRRDA